MSRAYTPEEVRERLLETMRSYVDYWATVEVNEIAKGPDIRRRLDGLAFSILNIFDGTSSELPAFDLIPSPHPSDKAFHEAEGENYFEAVVINADVHLHDEWYAEERARNEARRKK